MSVTFVTIIITVPFIPFIHKLKTVYKYSDFGGLKEQKEGYWVRDKGYLWWYVSFVDENGNLNTRGINAGVDMGVRLAVWIDIE